MMPTRNSFRDLSKNTGFILSLAIVFGLILSRGAVYTEPSIMPLLAVIVTLSITGVSTDFFLSPKKAARTILISLALNYGILSFAVIGLAYVIVPDYELWAGFIILSAVPPAIAVIPFTFRLNGNVRFSLTGTMAAYIAALGIVPLSFYIFLGELSVSVTDVLITIIVLIAVPLGVSQILRKTGVEPKIERYRGQIVNWGFFVVVYTVIGLNQRLFLERPDILLETSVIAFIATVAIAFASEHIMKRIGITDRDRISMVLMATRKNYGLAAAIALATIGPEAAMPSAVASIFNIAHFIWFSHRRKKP